MTKKTDSEKSQVQSPGELDFQKSSDSVAESGVGLGANTAETQEVPSTIMHSSNVGQPGAKPGRIRVGAPPEAQLASGELPLLARGEIDQKSVVIGGMDDSAGALGDAQEEKHSEGTLAKVTAKDVQNVHDFFTFAYTNGKSRRLDIPEAVWERIGQNQKESSFLDSAFEQLSIDFAESDPELLVPVRIFAAVEQSSNAGSSRLSILRLLGVVLRQYPVFAIRPVVAIFDEDRSDIDFALRSVSEFVRDQPKSSFSSKKTKEDARARFEISALTSLILWVDCKRRLTDAQFVQLVNRHVWSSGVGAKRPRSMLVDPRNMELLGFVSRRLQQQQEEFDGLIRESTQQLERSKEEVRQKNESLDLSRDESERLRGDVIRLEQQARELFDEIATQREQRAIDKTHFDDDYKRLRTRVLRALDKHSDTLRSALQALRSERFEVADEYVERSLEAIEGESNRLRGDG